MSRRHKTVAGNWKMNTTLLTARSLFEELHTTRDQFPSETRVLLFPPFLSVPELASRAAAEGRIGVGAQHCHFEEKGAYTGEISPAMLKAAGAEYCLVGHSERRSLFGETDEIVARKLKAVLDAGLTAVLCVGEPLDVRNQQAHFRWVERQIDAALLPLDAPSITRVIVAYEPVWAIGTGLTATPAQAEEMHAFIRQRIHAIAGEETAAQLSILYGGSCNASNAADLFAGENVDGGLVGGASLQAAEFLAIIQATR